MILILYLLEEKGSRDTELNSLSTNLKQQYAIAEKENSNLKERLVNCLDQSMQNASDLFDGKSTLLNPLLQKFLPTSKFLFDRTESVRIFVRAMLKDTKEWSPFYTVPDIPREYIDLKWNTEQGLYIVDILRDKHDWIINIDQDAFISNISTIFELMIEMETHDNDYLCFPDGGQEVRRHNPAACNPFFNIFRLKSIRRKINVADKMEMRADRKSQALFDKKFGSWNPYSEKAITTHHIAPECRSAYAAPYEWDNFEPSEPIFLFLRYHLSVKWACAKPFLIEPTKSNKKWPQAEMLEIDDDPVLWVGTILVTEKGLDYIYHSWYARNGLNSRINFLRLSALEKMEEVPAR